MLATTKARIAAALAVLGIVAAGAVPAAMAGHHHHHHGIPEHNGGDHDADNNGGPSDGDGRIYSSAQAIVAALDPASAAALPAPNKDWSPIRLAMSDRVLVLADPPEAGWRSERRRTNGPRPTRNCSPGPAARTEDERPGRARDGPSRAARLGPARIDGRPARPPTRGKTATEGHVLNPGTLGEHFDRLFRAAWALCGSREDAEDLVQDTYARVLARPRLLSKDDDLGYLLRVLRNTFISSPGRCAASSTGEPDPEALDMPTLAPAPPGRRLRPKHASVRGDRRAARHFREALVAIDVAGLSYREAATALQVRGGTITTRLFRARGRVAKSLSRLEG